MTRIEKGLLISLLGVFLMALPASIPAQTPPNAPCQEIVDILKTQNSHLSRELRRIQRELAALRAEIGTPGIRDVFAGVGYIFGFFGVAAFVAARRKG
jgi:nickel transport protein